MATIHDPEKQHGGIAALERMDSYESKSSSKVNDAAIDALTPEEQKKVIWRIDRRLVLTLGFLYCVSLMDRTNLGIAAVAGMATDLVLIGPRYSIITCIFFISYVLLQPPATVVLRKVGPRVFLPTITILWGVTMMCCGFLTNWKQFVGMRIVLGKLTIFGVASSGVVLITIYRCLRSRLLPRFCLLAKLLVSSLRAPEA